MILFLLLLLRWQLVTFCTCLFIFKAPSAAPRNFQVNSSSSLALDISWGAIPIEKRNGKLLGYYIYYRVDGSAVEYNKTVGPDKLSDQLTGLEFTTYVIRIAGYTAAGVGLSTRSMSQQPKAGSKGAIFDKIVCKIYLRWFLNIALRFLYYA